MITLSFKIFNPVVKTRNINMLWWAGGSFTKNKHWELDVSFDRLNTIFGIDVDTNFIGSDHAGIKFTLILFGFHLYTSMYDSRHWDYRNNRWTEYDS
jgi:hypothetical protein